MTNKQLVNDALGWGFILWLVGYVLGIVLIFVLPPSLIGWVIMPIGVIITLWVLLNKVKSKQLRHYIILAVVWTVLAVVCDYLFIVIAVKPADGYYKFDVFVYYALTFILPLIVFWWNKSERRTAP